MKKLLPVILSLLLLAGCADSGRGQMLKFISIVSGAEKISFTADVAAQYDEKTALFTLKYEKSGDEAVITVVKPDVLSGIKAHTSDDGASLEYDGAMLSLGAGYGDISPISALPWAIKAMTQGQLEMTWTEDDCVAARLVPADDYLVTVKINDALVPQSAEVCYRDRVAVTAQISDWHVE